MVHEISDFWTLLTIFTIMLFKWLFVRRLQMLIVDIFQKINNVLNCIDVLRKWVGVIFIKEFSLWLFPFYYLVIKTVQFNMLTFLFNQFRVQLLFFFFLFFDNHVFSCCSHFNGLQLFFEVSHYLIFLLGFKLHFTNVVFLLILYFCNHCFGQVHQLKHFLFHIIVFFSKTDYNFYFFLVLWLYRLSLVIFKLHLDICYKVNRFFNKQITWIGHIRGKLTLNSILLHCHSGGGVAQTWN